MSNTNKKKPPAKRGLQGAPQRAVKPSVSDDHPLASQPGRDQNALVVPLSRIEPDPGQPRQIFSDEGIQELADDIEVHGLLNPITVYEEDGKYRIVAGERRYRALQLLKRESVPVRVIPKERVREIQLAENIQREDLSLVEEAFALAELQEELNATQRELADAVKKSLGYLNRRLQIVKMPTEVQEYLRKNEDRFSKALDAAQLPDDERENAYKRLLEGKDPIPPKRGPGRPKAPVKYSEWKGGGIDLRVRYRPSEKHDRQEIIEKLRKALEFLESQENP